MKRNININDFKFEFAGYGHYKVTYTSPKIGKKWSATINNMSLIDATINAEEPKKQDLEYLKKIVKNDN